MKISIFTVCTPEFTPQEAAPLIKKAGYSGVEWRVAPLPPAGAPVNFWKGNRCSIDPATIMEKAPELRALCRKHRLEMPVLASYLNYKDLELLERVMEAASVLGTRCVRLWMECYDGKTRYEKLLARNVKGWERVVRLGQKYKVKPVAEIHHGSFIPSCASAWRFASHFSPLEMGLIHDAGNMVAEGRENWRMGLEMLGRYLAHVHVKNMAWSAGKAKGKQAQWSCAAVPLAEGQVEWREVLAALEAVGYKGWLSIEDFSAGRTRDKIVADAKFLRRLL